MRRTVRPLLIFLIAAIVLWSCGGGGGGGGSSTVFEVTIDNISDQTTLVTGAGPVPVVFSPAVMAVHSNPQPIFAAGEVARPNGLESLAEDGNGSALLESLSLVSGVSLLAVAQTPVGQQGGAPIGPGQSYKVLIRANSGTRLSVVSSFLQGNDLFISPGDQGISLFDSSGNAISGDVTSQFSLWDAGTEVNQSPGEGGDQVIRQADINTGASESNPVAPVNDGFSYPAIGAMLRVMITPQ